MFEEEEEKGNAMLVYKYGDYWKSLSNKVQMAARGSGSLSSSTFICQITYCNTPNVTYRVVFHRQ